MLKDKLIPAVTYFRNKEIVMNKVFEAQTCSSPKSTNAYKNEAKTFTTTDSKWYRDLNMEGFVNKIVPIVGSLPVQSASFLEVLKSIPEQHKGTDGIVYTKEEILAIFGILQRNEARSVFVKKGDKTFPRYAGMTPLVMYAFREIQNIKYSYWDKTDSRYNLLLNSTYLADGIKYAQEFEKPDMSEILQARQYQLDNNKPLSAHNQAKGFTASFPIIYRGGLGYRNAIMQSWICQPGTRVEDAMILDFYDLDNIPQPIETLDIVEKKIECDVVPGDELGI